MTAGFERVKATRGASAWKNAGESISTKVGPVAQTRQMEQWSGSCGLMSLQTCFEWLSQVCVQRSWDWKSPAPAENCTASASAKRTAPTRLIGYR